jgi:hypothetical protein
MNNYSASSGVNPNYKFVVFTSLNICVAFLFLLFATYLILRIKQLFGFRDRPMFLSILSIALSLATLITFLSISLAEQFQENTFLTEHIGLDMHACIGLLIEVFIIYALMIDLFKWCVFIAATSKT